MKYWQGFDITAEAAPTKGVFYYWNGEHIVYKPRRKRTVKKPDKRFRRHLLLFIVFGIGMYAAIVIALGAFGVA